MSIMVGPFQIIAERLAELGVYDFLFPWLITAAVFWGLLQKSKIFGESAVAVNSVISLAGSFFIWGYLISVSGVKIGGPLSSIITQSMLIIFAFVLALMGASLFYKDLPSAIEKYMEGGQWIWISIIILIVIFIISGGLGILSPIIGGKGDVGKLVVALLFLIIPILILGGTEMKG